MRRRRRCEPACACLALQGWMQRNVASRTLSGDGCGVQVTCKARRWAKEENVGSWSTFPAVDFETDAFLQETPEDAQVLSNRVKNVGNHLGYDAYFGIWNSAHGWARIRVGFEGPKLKYLKTQDNNPLTAGRQPQLTLSMVIWFSAPSCCVSPRDGRGRTEVRPSDARVPRSPQPPGPA